MGPPLSRGQTSHAPMCVLVGAPLAGLAPPSPPWQHNHLPPARSAPIPPLSVSTAHTEGLSFSQCVLHGTCSVWGLSERLCKCGRGRKERWRQKGGEEGEGRERGESNQQGGSGEGGRGKGGTGDAKLSRVLCLQLLRNLDTDFRDHHLSLAQCPPQYLLLVLCVFFQNRTNFQCPTLCIRQSPLHCKNFLRKLVSNFPSCVITRRLCSRGECA